MDTADKQQFKSLELVAITTPSLTREKARVCASRLKAESACSIRTHSDVKIHFRAFYFFALLLSTSSSANTKVLSAALSIIPAYLLVCLLACIPPPIPQPNLAISHSSLDGNLFFTSATAKLSNYSASRLPFTPGAGPFNTLLSASLKRFNSSGGLSVHLLQEKE